MPITRDNWFERAKGMEWAPERGERCTMCFDMSFERTALYVYEHGFPVIISSFGISRWKDMKQINGCGHCAAEPYPILMYWDYNWRNKGGSVRLIESANASNFINRNTAVESIHCEALTNTAWPTVVNALNRALNSTKSVSKPMIQTDETPRLARGGVD